MPDLLRQDTLVFVGDVFRERGWLSEHVYHAMVEHRILDATGREVGRVSQQPPAAQPLTLERSGDLNVCAAVYDVRDAKVVEFAVSNGMRRLRVFDWGRRLEVTDRVGRPVGAVVIGELRMRATLQDNSGERIGIAKRDRKVTTNSEDWICTIEDPTGAEVGWIAGARGHNRRLARGGAVARSPAAEQAAGLHLHHMLATTGGDTPDLRLMMLALAAGVHLVMSPWSGPRE